MRPFIFIDVRFLRADLRGADLRHSQFERCSFDEASMDNAILIRKQGERFSLSEKQTN